MNKIIIGVMGPGREATEKDISNAFELGMLIAKEGMVLLSGGLGIGVMDAVNKGAKAYNGLTIGIIPSKDSVGISSGVDIPVITGLGSARNYINILTSNFIIACGMSAGTASEISMAIKEKKSVIILSDNQQAISFFKILDPVRVFIVNNPQQALDKVLELVNK